MKVLKIIIYISFVFIVSCKSTSETQIKKIDSAKLISDQGIVYALPKTNIRFKVEAVRTDIFPGPYYEYAEKYMGLTDVPEKRETIWQISNIVIETYNDMDPENLYLLEPSGQFNVDLKSLINNGFIFPVNKQMVQKYENQFYGISELGNDLVFKDLSVSKYVGEEQVTYYKRVQRDSLFAKVPVVKTQSVYKSFEDKAEEASSFIFMIREKRFELITGMADYYPDGEALNAALKELDRLENEYMDLFIGKKITSTYTANFEFTPSEKDLHQPYFIFRFNEEKGVLPANDLTGRPIIVELETLKQVEPISNLIYKNENPEEPRYRDKIYYRIPDLVKVKVYDGSSLIALRKVAIEQYGQVVQIPAMYFMDEEAFIEFYREEDE